MLNTRVLEVKERTILFRKKEDIGRSNASSELSYGLCVWAGGTAHRPISETLARRIGEDQMVSLKTTGRLRMDPWLRLEGAPLGSVLACGDCAVTVGSDESTGGAEGSPRLPQTAQVAAQQGAYIAHLFNRQYVLSDPVPVMGPRPPSWIYYPLTALRAGGIQSALPFTFLNLGQLAYIGQDNAVAQVDFGESELMRISGSQAYFLWKSVYLVKQVSTRTRILVLFDYLKTWLFGRDLSAL